MQKKQPQNNLTGNRTRDLTRNLTLNPTRSSIRSPYEQTQLARHGVQHPDLLEDPAVPVEYITEVCEMDGLLFRVTPAVLIPRVETAELVNRVVQEVLSWVKNKFANGDWHRLVVGTSSEQVIRLLDVGTGSGYVGIAIADQLHKRLGADVAIELTLSDISAEALAVAKENAARLLQLKVRTVHGDLLAAVAGKYVEGKAEGNFAEENYTDGKYTDKKYTVITANLPYIPSQRVAQLDASVKDYEPWLALDGGEDGLVLIRRLLLQLAKNPSLLETNGSVWLEVDHTHTLADFELIKQHERGLQDFTFELIQDDYGQNRFVRVGTVQS